MEEAINATLSDRDSKTEWCNRTNAYLRQERLDIINAHGISDLQTVHRALKQTMFYKLLSRGGAPC